MNKRSIEFSFTKAEHLNSNSLPASFYQKGKIVAAIREKSRITGVAEHSHKEQAEERLEAFRKEEQLKIKKSQSHKRLKKAGCTKEEIEESLVKVEKDFGTFTKSSDITVPYLFNKFKVTVTVKTPTKRIVDPVNLYPTVKPLIDGLTDASWWEDDNFSYLLEINFKYGGLSGEKNKYTIVMDFEEASDHEKYITEAILS